MGISWNCTVSCNVEQEGQGKLCPRTGKHKELTLPLSACWLPFAQLATHLQVWQGTWLLMATRPDNPPEKGWLSSLSSHLKDLEEGLICLACVGCPVNFEWGHLVHAWHLRAHSCIFGVFQVEKAEQPPSPNWSQVCL